MGVLVSGLRKVLEGACIDGRRVSEGACRVALGSLGVVDERVPGHLSDGDRALRRGLRAKSRQLGDVAGSVELLVAECAFAQWHRLLFARFLAENGLLMHPQFHAPVTLAECEELASGLGEPDGWSVAGRFAAEILPGIFRLDDPCVRLRLAPEGRLALEEIVAGLPVEVFTADDSLGWVYQYWQNVKKDEVNASERKIGGADLGPVTQLFTENYMVRFLLENSLGAWWAARHPDSPLLKEWEFLRFDDDGSPAAGSFDGWPDTVGEVTVMDPCCGSGHFLVEAFSMLWQMRAEEEGLGPITAQDAVLRDNLFGLELDPRCVQIAMFAVALQAWKAGGGWRELPTPHIACSGIPVKAPVEDWKQLARGDERLENALVRLHILFRDADTLGSLIDPKRSVEISDPTGLQASFDDVEWDDIQPVLDKALSRETDDPATAVLGADAAGIARAADYLSRRYTLIATNVPYLGRGSQSESLRDHCDRRFHLGSQDLATVFVQRSLQILAPAGALAAVVPENWLYLKSFEAIRESLLASATWDIAVRLGAGAFQGISGEVVKPVLLGLSQYRAPSDHNTRILRFEDGSSVGREVGLKTQTLGAIAQAAYRSADSCRITFEVLPDAPPLRAVCSNYQGIKTGDNDRLLRLFWEPHAAGNPNWLRVQGAPRSTASFDGRSQLIYTDTPNDPDRSAWARVQGLAAWGRSGIAVGSVGELNSTLYCGDAFDSAPAVIVPKNERDLAALWAFAESGELARIVRVLDTKVAVTTAVFGAVPFDADHWRRVAEMRFPNGLPEPWSDDPTQWLFEGRPEVATEPLQVAVGRLLGYSWPEQAESDDLDELADDDGIVCLPSVLGESSAADRLQGLLARAFGGSWSASRVGELLSDAGSKKKDLGSWLRDEFFKQHCQVFQNRPFIWHIWDGRKDGFSALVNYHKLNRSALERLTYTYLGDWIERQTAGVRDDVAGAVERLAAAQDLQRKLKLILEGEPPYDVYVRWKSLAEQPVGWDPDLNDGVRLNVRPFVQADVLRSKFNVHWRKDRGKNPDGSERLNDLHYTRIQKHQARKGVNP